MQLTEDTRQHADKHGVKAAWFEAHGVQVFRSKLAAGDYALPPRAAVDTKRDIFELAGDIDRDHERFRREMLLARDMGTALTVLVENDDGVRSLDDLAGWAEPADHLKMRKAKTRNPRCRRIEGARLSKACRTMQEKYGVRFAFCSPAESAGRVLQILKDAEREGGENR